MIRRRMELMSNVMDTFQYCFDPLNLRLCHKKYWKGAVYNITSTPNPVNVVNGIFGGNRVDKFLVKSF